MDSNYELLIQSFNELKAKVELQNELLAKLINNSANTIISVNNKWAKADVACALLNCNVKLLYRLVAQGKISASNTGGKRHKLYDIDSVKAYIEQQSKLVLKKQPK